MPRPVRLLALLLFAFTGCGTVHNLNGVNVDNSRPWLGRRTTPYGGVVYDANQVARQARHFSGFKMSAYLADIPFSILGDTLTLPWTLGK